MQKELPIGWVETELQVVSEILDNLRKPINSTERGGRIGNIPYYGATGQAGWIDDYLFDEELVLVGEDGAPFFDKTKNVAYLINGKSWVNNHAHVLKAISKITSNKFLLHFLNQFDYKDFVGGTTRLKLTQGDLKIIPVPLPPLPEQHRIVAKLDTLFGHLDALKTRLDRIPQLLKDFRQKVLTQAVTGKLTEEWREGRELEEWRESPLNEFSTSRLGKMLDKEKNQGIPTKYLRNINVRWFDFDLDDLFEIKVSEEEMQKYSIQNGDVLVFEGGEPGRAAIWRNGNTNIIFQKALHRVRLNNTVLPEFFLYNLKVDSVNNVLSSLFTGTTIKHLTGVAFSDYSINIPPIEEQQEIVRRVESLFAKADQIEASYQKLKAKIEQLPQAILAKAFRGELVAQLPTDGDARELLEQIKLAKAGLEKGGKTKKMKGNDDVRMVAEEGARYGK